MASAIPDGYRTLTPYLRMRRASEAIEFYKKAFGAEVKDRFDMPGGMVGHAALKIGDSMLMLSDEFPDRGVVGPETLKGTTGGVHVYVEDVDKAMAKAVAAGAKVTMPAMDMFWGDRFGKLVDPFGHEWGIATHKRDLAPDEVKKAGAEAMKKMDCG